jgi:hypothetical protein
LIFGFGLLTFPIIVVTFTNTPDLKRTLVSLRGSDLTSPATFPFTFASLILDLPNLLLKEVNHGKGQIQTKTYHHFQL